MPMTSAGLQENETAQPPSARRNTRHRFFEARRAGGAMGILCAILATGSIAAAPALASSRTIETFASTGSEQSFTVPAGVYGVFVRAIGEAGEAGIPFGPSIAAGGDGALVSGELPVTPGEVLYVEVAAGGFNGGAGPSFGGGAGGGASDVRTVPLAGEGTLESRLLVAGGGGGGGGAWELGTGGRGGDAGMAGSEGLFGEGTSNEGFVGSLGGGAATLAGGGSSAARCHTSGPWWGQEGSFGSGGYAGEAFENPQTGGGGGGGGYWGGGGGEGQCPFSFMLSGAGGGGGGGSSYVTEEAGSESFGLAASTTPPSVSISYATPSTATPNTSEISFPGTQPLATVSAPMTITVANSGGNPLAISGESFTESNPARASDHPEDFLISSSTCLGAVAFEASCQITVRFAPQGSGTQTASLQIAGNMAAGPTVVELTGTGGELPHGDAGESGATGATGAAGTAGASGEPGKPGAIGPQGERGPRGLTATYVCHPRRLHGKYLEACFVRVPAASKAAVKATLRRGRVVYASAAVNGAAASGGGLLLPAQRSVPAGRYTLVLTSRHGVSSQIVTVG